MLRWWLNLRWSSEAHEDLLAKADLAMALLGLTMIVAFIASLRA